MKDDHFHVISTTLITGDGECLIYLFIFYYIIATIFILVIFSHLFGLGPHLTVQVLLLTLCLGFTIDSAGY